MAGWPRDLEKSRACYKVSGVSSWLTGRLASPTTDQQDPGAESEQHVKDGARNP